MTAPAAASQRIQSKVWFSVRVCSSFAHTPPIIWRVVGGGHKRNLIVRWVGWLFSD